MLRILPTVSILALLVSSMVHADDVERISVDSSGLEGNQPAGIMTLSSDGRYAAFDSASSNLVPGDTNGVSDLFVRDRLLGTTTRISVSSAGGEGNGPSFCPVLSDDGRFVVFSSIASNLVPNDTNSDFDVFIHDRESGATELVSVDSNGLIGNGASFLPTGSSDGRYVTFVSDATNLVAGDTNLRDDVFVRDRAAGTTTRVSVGAGGTEANGHSSFPIISASGRYVSFSSTATNLAASDTNGLEDVFRHDLITGVTERVSVSSAGLQATGGSTNIGIDLISADGRFVAFSSGASNLVAGDTNSLTDVFVRDMDLGTTVRASLGDAGQEPDNHCLWAAIDAFGRYVAFETASANLIMNDNNGAFDVYLRDLARDSTVLMSADAAGVIGNVDSFAPAFSSDGRHTGFSSAATNLVSGDTNVSIDIFVRSRCWVEFQSFGMGLAGSGGIVPSLSGKNGACVEGFSLAIDQVLGGAAGLLFIGAAELAQSPVLGGTFYIDLGAPVVAVALVVSGRSGIIGTGSFSFPAADATPIDGSTIVMQFLAADPGAAAGVSMTNAIRVHAGV